MRGNGEFWAWKKNYIFLSLMRNKFYIMVINSCCQVSTGILQWDWRPQESWAGVLLLEKTNGSSWLDLELGHNDLKHFSPVLPATVKNSATYKSNSTWTFFLFYINIAVIFYFTTALLLSLLKWCSQDSFAYHILFSFPGVSAQQWFLINTKELLLWIVEFSELLSTVHFTSFQLKDEPSWSAWDFPLNHWTSVFQHRV